MFAHSEFRRGVVPWAMRTSVHSFGLRRMDVENGGGTSRGGSPLCCGLHIAGERWNCGERKEYETRNSLDTQSGNSVSAEALDNSHQQTNLFPLTSTSRACANLKISSPLPGSIARSRHPPAPKFTDVPRSLPPSRDVERTMHRCAGGPDATRYGFNKSSTIARISLSAYGSSNLTRPNGLSFAISDCGASASAEGPNAAASLSVDVERGECEQEVLAWGRCARRASTHTPRVRASTLSAAPKCIRDLLLELLPRLPRTSIVHVPFRHARVDNGKLGSHLRCLWTEFPLHPSARLGSEVTESLSAHRASAMTNPPRVIRDYVKTFDFAPSSTREEHPRMRHLHAPTSPLRLLYLPPYFLQNFALFPLSDKLFPQAELLRDRSVACPAHIRDYLKLENGLCWGRLSDLVCLIHLRGGLAHRLLYSPWHYLRYRAAVLVFDPQSHALQPPSSFHRANCVRPWILCPQAVSHNPPSEDVEGMYVACAFMATLLQVECGNRAWTRPGDLSLGCVSLSPSPDVERFARAATIASAPCGTVPHASVSRDHGLDHRHILLSGCTSGSLAASTSSNHQHCSQDLSVKIDILQRLDIAKELKWDLPWFGGQRSVQTTPSIRRRVIAHHGVLVHERDLCHRFVSCSHTSALAVAPLQLVTAEPACVASFEYLLQGPGSRST
ncbi:hypothetical protein B0H14DRAFT_2560628 [Mycena olivaceomarginata]|nr:hypothetical protein B0H14DRAFT_2560628 [Mycena olivaceomarginata]